MGKKSIIIKGDTSNVLSVKLADILKYIKDGENFKWSILFLSGVLERYSNESIEILEQNINKSKVGFLLEFKELQLFSNKFQQIIEILIIGDKDVSNLKRYTEGKKMFQKCDIVLELVDSSYWIVNAESSITEYLKSKLPLASDFKE
jgi:hypothetical protein